MSKPVRIVSIAHTAVSREAGRLRYYPLAERRDIDLHLVVPDRWRQFGRKLVADPPDDPGFAVHVLPVCLQLAGPFSWYLHFYSGLDRLLRDLKPDVIHLWEEPWSVVALQARMLKGSAALVMEVDQNILKRLPFPFEAIRKEVLSHTDHVLSRSPGATAVVRARGYTGPVSPISYGVDRATFRPSAGLVSCRQSNILKIGYVGRLVEEKGLDDALDAMSRGPATVSLALMGEGPYETRLRQRIDQLGLGDRVMFRGWGTPVDVADFISQLDVLVLLTRTTPSVSEQFGRVIVEAQACGVPVIGASSGAIPDVVGQGGWIVPERDPVALAQLLESIANDPATVASRGIEARRNVESRFTYEAVAESLASACVSAASRTRAA